MNRLGKEKSSEGAAPPEIQIYCIKLEKLIAYIVSDLWHFY